MGATSMDLIEQLQDSAPWLMPVAGVLTLLGDEDFYVLVFPVLYWAISPRIGARIGVALLFSAALNSVLKLAFATPRPFWVSEGIDAHVIETSFGVPSGHAQNAVVVWGLLAYELHRRRGWRWVWVPTVALIAGIGVSRWYLGVHAVEDTLIGWTVGVVLVIAHPAIEPRLTAYLTRAGIPGRLVLAVVVPLGLVAAAVAARAARPGLASPQLWLDNVAAVAPDVELLPMSISSTVTAAGALCGLGLGLILLHARTGGFAPHPALWRRPAAFVVGLVGAAALWLAVGAAVPGGDDPLAVLLRFVNYTAVGGWIAGIAPLVFLHTGLAVPAGGFALLYESGSAGSAKSGTPSDSNASRTTRNDSPPG